MSQGHNSWAMRRAQEFSGIEMPEALARELLGTNRKEMRKAGKRGSLKIRGNMVRKVDVLRIIEERLRSR